MGALQILGRIYAGGKESRLYKALVDAGLATDVVLSNNVHHDTGLLMAYAFLTPKATHEKVLAIMREEARKLCTRGISRRELSGIKAHTKAETAMSKDGVYAIASGLNEPIAVGDWRLFIDYAGNIQAVKKNEVQKMAKTYLIEDQSVSGFFIAKNV